MTTRSDRGWAQHEAQFAYPNGCCQLYPLPELPGRVAHRSRQLLKAWAMVSQVPAWQIVSDMVLDGVKALSAQDRRRI